MSRYRRSHTPGATFFFTVTLADRGSSALTERMAALRAAYSDVARARPFQTLAICVLPDHLHAVWELPHDDADFSGRWSQIKSSFSRGSPAVMGRSASKRAKREKGIWQRRFWEHQIRDEIDLQRHIDYIHYNPVKHGLAGRVADWPYSSFHRYVSRGWLTADWGGVAVGAHGYGEPG
jgi:putative transposase